MSQIELLPKSVHVYYELLMVKNKEYFATEVMTEMYISEVRNHN